MFIVSLFNNGNNSCVEFRNIDYYFFKNNFVFFDIFYVWVNEIVFILVKRYKSKIFCKMKVYWNFKNCNDKIIFRFRLKIVMILFFENEIILVGVNYL